MITWSIYGSLVILDYFSFIAFGWTQFTGIVAFSIFSATAWSVVSLADTMGSRLKTPEDWWLGALIPLFQIVAAVLLIRKAADVFRESNIKVTFWGADNEQVRRQVAGLLCTQCAYNLTGNESGVCPECGTKIKSDHA
ncbi:MAG: hypothetical protein DHS20C16_28280 [Phycisphaerae bacterium]|nr:MAG: hypothetical protein DHS20C16_28280 [Phycisphaerae bacterium]